MADRVEQGVALGILVVLDALGHPGADMQRLAPVGPGPHRGMQGAGEAFERVEQLGEVDVTGIEPMTAVIENRLRLREDVINADPLTGGGKRDAVLANAPAAEHGFFGVPKVIE